jgi:hypothetical protein
MIYSYLLDKACSDQEGIGMGIVDIGIGFLLLLAGRPAYWIFVGGVTYLIGSYFARQQIAFGWSWNNLLLGLVFTLAGISLAFSFNRWAARLAGFLAGVYLVRYIPTLLIGQAEITSSFYYVIAGMAAVILISISFNLGMVLISSFVGTTMILTNIHLENMKQNVIFLMLVIISIIAQYLLMLFMKPSPD